MVALELEPSNRTGILGVARFAHVIDLIASWIIEQFSFMLRFQLVVLCTLSEDWIRVNCG